MWEKIKQHPWIVGGAVGLLLLVLLFSSSSKGVATSSDSAAGTSSGTGDQLQAYLASLNLQGQQIAAAGTAAHEQTAAAVQIAQIDASSKDTANTLAAQVAEFTTKLQSDVLMNRDTLSAQVAQSNNSAQVQLATINATQAVQQSTIFANTVTHQSDVQAETTRQYISSLPGIINAQNAPATAAASKSCSSYLFGLFSSC